MTRESDESTVPDPTSGLTDPRTLRHEPEMFSPTSDPPMETGPDDAPVAEPSGRDEEGEDLGARGLVDPRSEIPDPTEP